MKRGILVLSLFLISLLVISGCAQDSPKKNVGAITFCEDRSDRQECESLDCSWCKMELSNEGGWWSDTAPSDGEMTDNEIFFDPTTGEGWWFDISGCNLNCQGNVDINCNNEDVVSYPGYCAPRDELCLLPGDIGGGEGFDPDPSNLPFSWGIGEPDNYLDIKDLLGFAHHINVGLNEGIYSPEELVKEWPQADIACSNIYDIDSYSETYATWQCKFGQIDVNDVNQMICIFGLS